VVRLAFILSFAAPMIGVEQSSAASNDDAASSDLFFRRTSHFGEDIGASRGVAWADFDNDGDVDLVVSNTSNQPLHLYRNFSGKRFERVIDDEIAAFSGYAEGVVWIDIDNDGWSDLFVATTAGANLLFRNRGGKFERVTGSKLTDGEINTSMGCWDDFDNDGYLDVFLATRGGAPDLLFRNVGGRRFEEVKIGISDIGTDARSCAWADFNGDGWPDIYVGDFIKRHADGVERKAANRLYINVEGKDLRSEAQGHAVNTPSLTYNLSPADYDYDGDIDLFQTNIALSDANYLYENLNYAELYPRTDFSLSLKGHGPSKGSTWGDFDHDGDLDLFVAEGTEGLTPADAPFDAANNLFLATETGFERVVRGDLVETLEISAGTASGDFDNDGDLDLFVANWGGEGEKNVLYENLAQDGWIKFQLVGKKSNRMGAGAVVEIDYERDGKPASQTRTRMLQTGYASANETEFHFGLGTATRINEACVTWRGGRRQCHKNLEARRVYILEEGGGSTGVAGDR